MNRRGRGGDENDWVDCPSLAFYTTTSTTTTAPIPTRRAAGTRRIFTRSLHTYAVVAHLHGHCASARSIAHLHGWVPRSSLPIYSPTLAVAITILSESMTPLTRSLERGRFRRIISDREFRRQPSKGGETVVWWASNPRGKW